MRDGFYWIEMLPGGWTIIERRGKLWGMMGTHTVITDEERERYFGALGDRIGDAVNGPERIMS